MFHFTCCYLWKLKFLLTSCVFRHCASPYWDCAIFNNIKHSKSLYIYRWIQYLEETKICLWHKLWWTFWWDKHSSEEKEEKTSSSALLYPHRFDGTIKDMPQHQMAPLAISPRDGRVSHSLGNVIWMGTTTDGKKQIKIKYHLYCATPISGSNLSFFIILI